MLESGITTRPLQTSKKSTNKAPTLRAAMLPNSPRGCLPPKSSQPPLRLYLACTVSNPYISAYRRAYVHSPADQRSQLLSQNNQRCDLVGLRRDIAAPLIRYHFNSCTDDSVADHPQQSCCVYHGKATIPVESVTQVPRPQRHYHR